MQNDPTKLDLTNHSAPYLDLTNHQNEGGGRFGKEVPQNFSDADHSDVDPPQEEPDREPYRIRVGKTHYTINYGTTAVSGPSHNDSDEWMPHLDAVKLNPVISHHNELALSYYNPPKFENLEGIKEFWVVFSSEESEVLALSADEADDLELAEDEYAIKIAVVDFGSTNPVNQIRWGHIEVVAHAEIVSSSESSSSSESESSSSSLESSDESSEDSGDESDKSTCIVPDPLGEYSHVALFCVESPSVVFIDTMEFDYLGEDALYPIDKRFVGVCEKGTLKVAGATSDEPSMIGCSVKNSHVRVKCVAPLLEPKRIVIHLTGVRKKFLNHRFPKRSKLQFVMNERFLNSAYPKK